ncbi:MAG: hypothetical protein WBF04_14175 [Candidatus Sulfotelmatobacter sp.]
MHNRTFALTLLLATSPSLGAGAQAGSEAAAGSISAEAPAYRVTFERRDAIPGIIASSAIKLPFVCTTDGTVFVGFLNDTVPSGMGLPAPPPVLPLVRLVSFSTTGKGQTFDLAQVTDLYISSELDHFVSESEVAFLVRAAREYKPKKKTYAIKGGGQGEFSSNAAEQRQYLVIFDRDGTYRKTIDVEDLPLRIENLGVFPSGTFLAFGSDPKDESPRLAMLKEDGTLLMPLEIKKGDVPESMIGKAGGARPGVIAPAQFLPEGRSIIIVQNESTFPLLEVSEGGAIEAIHPKLPRNSSIKALIPSDRNLYAIVTQPGADSASKETIYEVSREDGNVLGRFDLADGRRPSQIACIHDQKFLSLDHGEGKIIPLVGSPEPANTTDQ